MSDFLNTQEAAELLRRKPNTLENWRCKGIGPVYYKVDGSVLYNRDELEKYVISGKVEPNENVSS